MRFINTNWEDHHVPLDMRCHVHSHRSGYKRRHVSRRRAGPVLASIARSQDRYCLQGKISGYPGNCLFSTYSQCMATASGTNAYCGLSPIYAFREWQGYR